MQGLLKENTMLNTLEPQKEKWLQVDTLEQPKVKLLLDKLFHSKMKL